MFVLNFYFTFYICKYLNLCYVFSRVTLDMLSVQGNIEKPWLQKIEKGFWMGRDSSKHRLNLVELSKLNPDILNASITNFFFYKELKEKYGPGKKPISFFKFFDV